PLYFIYDQIGIKDPPPLTHPLFYYGFAGVTLAWQVVSLVVSTNPVRFRTLMLVGILEKLGYFLPAVALYLQHKIHPIDFIGGCIDITLGVFFVLAYLKTPARQ